MLQDVEDLCNDWQPEPLFKAATDNQPDYDPLVISGYTSNLGCHMLCKDGPPKQALEPIKFLVCVVLRRLES